MKNGICKFCGQERPLVKAHVIPQSFHDFSRQGDFRPSTIYSKGEYPKRSPTGIYDEELACRKCEDIFARLDDYGARILLPEFSGEKCIKSNDCMRGIYQGPTYDYAQLKLFLLSVLWRMSATRQPEFYAISLGPHEMRIANMIKAKDPGPPDKYAVVLSRFTDLFGHYYIGHAHRTRIATRHLFNIFYLGGYKVRVQVDSQPVPQEIVPFILRPKTPLTILLEDSKNGREFEEAISLVSEGERMRGTPRHRSGKSDVR